MTQRGVLARVRTLRMVHWDGLSDEGRLLMVRCQRALERDVKEEART